MVKLATQVRGDAAKQPYYQFFCPMVSQGEGDWLQQDDKLLNPYFGSKMLHCGKLVSTFAPVASTRSKTDQNSGNTNNKTSSRPKGE